MDWMNQLGGLLGQYQGATPNQAPQNVDNDFDQVAQHAPPQAMAQGLAAAFRSDQTPPFGQMASQLFGQSNPQQRAGLMNTVLSAAGPALMGRLMGGGMSGMGGGAMGGLGSLLGGLMGGGGQAQQGMPQQMPQITPEQAAQVSPEQFGQLADHAQQQDPSIIDQVSNFYAQQPALVKTLGAGALTLLLAKLATNSRQ